MILPSAIAEVRVLLKAFSFARRRSHSDLSLSVSLSLSHSRERNTNKNVLIRDTFSSVTFLFHQDVSGCRPRVLFIYIFGILNFNIFSLFYICY